MKFANWISGTLAVAAFAGVAVIFVRETLSFHAAVLEWAGNDLRSRTEIAVETLREPLRAGDFAAVRRFSDECATDGIRLCVYGKPRGIVFDSGSGVETRACLFGPEMDADAFTIRLALPRSRVLAPFVRARKGFLLAALLGVTGVLVFFVVIYRQRVRLAEMARVERFRSEFIADVSHEIRTPLTGILGAVDLLGDETPLAKLIRKESQRLNRLVQSILDLARLEREGDVLHRVSVRVDDVLREVRAACAPTAAAADVAVTLHPVPEGLCVWADPSLLVEAVSNLILNAVRHSGAKEVFVSAAREGRSVRIAVEDHGVGIPPEHVPHVFERFHRVDPARAAETGGAGLGLAIVRRIARLHGGDVSYAPAVPHGCVFTLSLSA